MSELNQYDRVRLVTDRFRDEGATEGMIGYIIEVYGEDAFEIEFTQADGVTIAQLVAAGSDLEKADG